MESKSDAVVENEWDVERAIKSISGSDLSVAEEGSSFLESQVRDQRNFQVITDLKAASTNFVRDSIVYMRFVKLFCKLSGLGEEEFKYCEQVGVVQDVVSLCTTDDILMQMNAIEMLAGLADTNRGLEYMCTNNIISWLVNTSCGDSTNATRPDPLISTEALRVLGSVFLKSAAKRFDMLTRINGNIVTHFLRTIQTHCEEGSEDERLAALGALADFALISVATLELVVEGTGLADAWMGLLINQKSEVVAAVLQSVAVVLSQPDAQYVATRTDLTVFSSAAEMKSAEALSGMEKVSALKKKLLHKVGAMRHTSTVSYLLKLATQPVEATRHAAVDLLRAVAEQPGGWGLQMLFQFAASPSVSDNFYLYLQERLTEYCKEGKDWKWALILAIWQNPARHHLPAEVNEHLDMLIRQGAYYLPPMQDVQTMEA